MTGVQTCALPISASLKDLEAEREAAVADLKDRQDQLFARLFEQLQLTNDIQKKVDRAKQLVADLSKKYQQELAALAGNANPPAGAISGILFHCPVDQPRVVWDGFGAPRYSGGYHPHAGNDIIAPQGTPIRAPFDGTAKSSYNTLGGNSEYVYGSQGYVYNAHLSRYSSNSNGPVKAGDIIGYVGETGDTDTPHDHFEWHPSVIPSSWPTSPYGYRVVARRLRVEPAEADVVREVFHRYLDLGEGVRVIARRMNEAGVTDRKSTRLNSSHMSESRMPSSA